MKENFILLCKSIFASPQIVKHIIDYPEKYYTSKAKPKMKFGKPQRDESGNLKIRELTPPVSILKEIQGTICYHLQTKILPDCMYGSIQKSNNILNALQHINNKFFLTIDLKNFFTNISNNQVHHTLMNIGFGWEEASILTKLTTLKGSLPQGAPTSPVLANLCFANTALQLQSIVESFGITFTVFLDDLTFSSKKDFKHLVSELLGILKSNHFYPHPKKIHYRKNFCEVTGLIVGKGKIKVTADIKEAAEKNRHIKAYILNINKTYKKIIEQA